MGTFAHGYRALSIAVAAAVLAACSGSQPPIGAPAAPSQTRADTSSQSLLYVSDKAKRAVYVYTYPDGKLVTKLPGFDDPRGECTDAQGDVYVTDYGAQAVIEYAHSGTAPIATLHTSPYEPAGCSVDPIRGNLAVAGVQSLSGAGAVLVFKHARGDGRAYRNSSLDYYQACGYDIEGDLFVAGRGSGSNSFALAELARQGKKLRIVKFNRAVVYPIGIQNQGTYLAIGDSATLEDTSSVYQVVPGKKGVKMAHTTNIGVVAYGFFIEGDTLLASGYRGIYFFKYPRGGLSTKYIPQPHPIGVVVSTGS